MKIEKVMVLELKDAKELLVNFYADFLVADKENLKTLLREGTLHELVNLKNANSSVLFPLLKDFGDAIFSDMNVDRVLLLDAAPVFFSIWEKKETPVWERKVEGDEIPF